MPTGLVKVSADFSTTLALGVSAGDTTATLSSVTNSEGQTLANGTYSFTIDRKNSSKEHIVATVTGTALSSIVNVSAKDGTETSGFANAHRKGAEVIISDWVAIKRIQDVLETGYAAATTPSTDYQLATKKYVDDASFAGGTNASTTTPGFVELPTQAEVDAGTSSGGSGPLVVTPDLLRAKMYHDYVVDAVGTDAYAITVSPAITAYTAGQVFTFKIGTANTGSCTLNVNGLGAKTIKKNVNNDLVTGDLLANMVCIVVYDGTNMQLVSSKWAPSPVSYTYDTVSTAIGDSTTQFDITNTAGSTYRYTWDSTGTDPGISLANFPVGSIVNIQAQNFASGNKGIFAITGAGSNYFEVTNASGVVESNKTIGTGHIVKSGTVGWSKPDNLSYIIVEVVGGGAGAGGLNTDADGALAGGSAGGYAMKKIAASSLSSTEYFIIGAGGTGASSSTLTVSQAGRASAFGTHLYATGASQGSSKASGTPGIGVNGDRNFSGGPGGSGYSGTTDQSGSGIGGSSFFGGGAPGVGHDSEGTDAIGYGGGGSGSARGGSGGALTGGDGYKGCVIVTEYYG